MDFRRHGATIKIILVYLTTLSQVTYIGCVTLNGRINHNNNNNDLPSRAGP
jgi:hypothetical protein